MDKSTPTTPSERYLARLCGQAFLRLWSYPNLYRDQGKTKDGHGKELCDLLVVFGDDLIIFSDKHCILRSDGNLVTAWSRWYRDAVIRSARQIAGAERWLRDYPGRVFTDRTCTQHLPIDILATARIHRVVTCRGAAAASQDVWGGNGSLVVTNEALADCLANPLHLGAFDDADRMIHVFDEVALDLVLGTLDTVSDFCAYLQKKELFFRTYRPVIAAGEEELLAFYLSKIAKDGPGHDFIVEGDPTSVFIDEGHWEAWERGKQRAAKINADRWSYSWDALIEKFVHHLLGGTQHFKDAGEVREQEVIVRWMARENRMRRRILTERLLSAMESTAVGQIRRRLVVPSLADDPFWVFMVLPRPPDIEYERYRLVRREHLRHHCMVVKYLHPSAEHIVAIAVDPTPEEASEDAMYLDARSWSAEAQSAAQELHETFGIFRSPNWFKSTDWEFPIPFKPKQGKSSNPTKDRKRKRKAAKTARRKNR